MLQSFELNDGQDVINAALNKHGFGEVVEASETDGYFFYRLSVPLTSQQQRIIWPLITEQWGDGGARLNWSSRSDDEYMILLGRYEVSAKKG